MSVTFSVPSFAVPVIAAPDLCVVGGGAAGVAAAVAAGRLGLKTLLVERYGFCGGAAVAGLSGTICGLHSSGDRPEQIVFGFAEEFRGHLERFGGIGTALPFGRTMLVPHDPFTWKNVADCLLADASVEVLYHCVFLRAYAIDNRRIDTILVRGLEGIVAIQPKYVIDASGDAEVVHSASATTTYGKNGVVQTPTMIFRIGGVQMNSFLELDQVDLCCRIAEASRAGHYELPRSHVYLFPMPNKHEVLCNMTRVTLSDGSAPSGIVSRDLTFAEIAGRKQVKEYHRFLRDHVKPFCESYIVDTGAQIGVRQTRSIVGKAMLMNDDVLKARKYSGAASLSAWPIEAHGAGDLKIVYLDNDHYDIPFETMIPDRGENLLAAGRCLSAEYEALASARVTAQCFGMGYAAGAACGLMQREGIASHRLLGVDVAAWMRDNGLKTASE